jgi:hypothetical protein
MSKTASALLAEAVFYVDLFNEVIRDRYRHRSEFRKNGRTAYITINLFEMKTMELLKNNK